MSTPCSLCTPPDRAALDAQPTTSGSQVAMARREESSRHAVANHHKTSLGLAPALPVALSSPAPEPAPDPAPAPDPPDQPPRTVAACEARAQTLEQALAAANTQLKALTARRADLQEKRAAARFLERWAHLAAVEEALAEVEPICAALPARQRELSQALADAHRALERAMVRRQEAKKQHWRQVRAQLNAAREQEDLALLASLERHEHGAWLQYCSILVGQDYCRDAAVDAGYRVPAARPAADVCPPPGDVYLAARALSLSRGGGCMSSP